MVVVVLINLYPGDKLVYIFTHDISPKINTVLQFGFELFFYNVTFQFFCPYTVET